MNDHIASVCHKYGLDKESTVNRMSIMVDKEHKVAFCRNAKVPISPIFICSSYHEVFFSQSTSKIQ